MRQLQAACWSMCRVAALTEASGRSAGATTSGAHAAGAGPRLRTCHTDGRYCLRPHSWANGVRHTHRGKITMVLPYHELTPRPLGLGWYHARQRVRNGPASRYTIVITPLYKCNILYYKCNKPYYKCIGAGRGMATPTRPA